MRLKKRNSLQKVRTTTSQLSTDEEPGPRATNINLADNHEEITALDEEATKLDQNEAETQAMGITAMGMANFATFARSRDIVKKNAGSDSKRISCAAMLKDITTGPRFTSWMKTRPKPSTPSITKRSDLSRETIYLTLPDSHLEQEPQPFPCNPRVFSKELDDSPHPSS
jgi:hypothetical protein